MNIEEIKNLRKLVDATMEGDQPQESRSRRQADFYNAFGPHQVRTVLALAEKQLDTFQQRVQPWMIATFGAEIAADTAERNHRFLEESLELVQACGCTASEAHQLVDYVFGRPVGESTQEVGGVMITLAALCLANDLDMHSAGETELTRIWTKVEAIRAKQAAKPKHSPLPQAQPRLSAVRSWNAIRETAFQQSIDACYKAVASRSQIREFGTAAHNMACADAIRAIEPPTATGRKDACEEMRKLCSACGGSGHAGDVAARSAP